MVPYPKEELRYNSRHRKTIEHSESDASTELNPNPNRRHRKVVDHHNSDTKYYFEIPRPPERPSNYEYAPNYSSLSSGGQKKRFDPMTSLGEYWKETVWGKTHSEFEYHPRDAIEANPNPNPNPRDAI